MRALSRNVFIYQIVISFLATASLTGCTMPEKPDGMDTQSMTVIGNQLRTQGDDAGAADFYQRALAHNPKDQETRKDLADILEAHGDNADAAIQYQNLVALDSSNADYLRSYGRVLLKLNRPEDAKNEYEAALQIDSSDVKALNGLGVALDYLGNHAAAQKAYQEAIEDDADDLTAVNNLAHSYVLVGNYDGAIALLEPHAKDKSATPSLRQNLAEAYGMAGMDADAQRMGLMDLPPDQVKRNLDYYRARRAKLGGAGTLYADLGSYPTEVMAEVRAEETKDKWADDASGLIVSVTPEVKAINSTPTFTVHVAGFSTAAKVKAFCDRLKKDGAACKAHAN